MKNATSDLTHGGESEPQRVTLRVTTSAKTRRAAARIARRHAGRSLEAVLATFVGELARADGRPGRWSQNLVAVWLLTRVWPRPDANDLP